MRYTVDDNQVQEMSQVGDFVGIGFYTTVKVGTGLIYCTTKLVSMRRFGCVG